MIDFEQLIIEHSSAFKSDFVGLADFRKYLAVFSLHGPEEYIISEAIKVMSNEPFDYRSVDIQVRLPIPELAESGRRCQ